MFRSSCNRILLNEDGQVELEHLLAVLDERQRVVGGAGERHALADPHDARPQLLEAHLLVQRVRLYVAPAVERVVQRAPRVRTSVRVEFQS